MTTSIERALTLRVAEVMSHEAVSISVNATMAEAAHVLCSQNVCGAPVVNEMGHCVGVLSARDFAERAQNERPGGFGIYENGDYTMVPSLSNTPMHVEQIIEGRVRRYMQSAIQTVTPCTSVLDAARIMTCEHVHRLVVLDADSHPLGVVSSLDLLKGLVKELSSP